VEPRLRHAHRGLVGERAAGGVLLATTLTEPRVVTETSMEATRSPPPLPPPTGPPHRSSSRDLPYLRQPVRLPGCRTPANSPTSLPLPRVRPATRSCAVGGDDTAASRGARLEAEAGPAYLVGRRRRSARSARRTSALARSLAAGLLAPGRTRARFPRVGRDRRNGSFGSVTGTKEDKAAGRGGRRPTQVLRHRDGLIAVSRLAR
jgi:hypothetical protein